MRISVDGQEVGTDILNSLNQPRLLMKKFFKLIGIVIASIVAILIMGALAVQLRGIPTYDTAQISYEHHPTAAKLKRG
jgi:hypothetical protein